jgi:hypothetical protein
MTRRRQRKRRRPTRGVFASSRRFAQRYAEGVRPAQLPHVLRRQASEAYAVITRDQSLENEPRKGLKRLLFRARVLFLGISFKLTPPRRLLFAASVLAAVFGILGGNTRFTVGENQLVLDTSGFWFILSIAGLLLLVTLELVDRVRVRDEIDVAQQLQQELLPQSTPNLDGWAFAHSYRTANDIGGDYYDFQLLPDGDLALVVGDASGHGMAAGLLMAVANVSLKTALDFDTNPASVLALLNRALWRTGDRRSFMTLFYGKLDPHSGHLEYASAGHPYPLIRRDKGGVEEIGMAGLPLGIRDALPITVQTLDLRRGDVLLLYSDGVPEATGPDGNAFGYRRLSQALEAGGSADEVHDRLLGAVEAHRGDETLRDDLTIVAVERLRETRSTR